VRVGGHEYPVRVIAVGPTKIELEIAGEPAAVEGWVPTVADPAEPILLNGERFRVHVQVTEAPTARPPTAPATRVPRSEPPAGPPPPSTASGTGTPIVPPMPGKVIEVRVQLGDRVTAGQVLLVLEAMKMRNEVASPVSGRVAALLVQAGTNVRAREPMVVVTPE
jgi:biotin carboxyl carrier protein